MNQRLAVTLAVLGALMCIVATAGFAAEIIDIGWNVESGGAKPSVVADVFENLTDQGCHLWASPRYRPLLRRRGSKTPQTKWKGGNLPESSARVAKPTVSLPTTSLSWANPLDG